jgi:hypothetical protein
MKFRLNSMAGCRVFAVLLLLAATAMPAWGQGCAMCYTQAASAGARMVQALRSGILVLIFPPMGICIGLMVMSYKKRNRFHEDSPDRRSDLGW